MCFSLFVGNRRAVWCLCVGNLFGLQNIVCEGYATLLLCLLFLADDELKHGISAMIVLVKYLEVCLYMNYTNLFSYLEPTRYQLPFSR